MVDFGRDLVMAHLGRTRLCWNNGRKMCLLIFYRQTHTRQLMKQS